MLYTKDGFPEVNEVVKCTVTKIFGNTTFVTVDEYEKEGVLTISEIAPGRIRNLREHVMEGKVIICKVIRVDAKNNRIDVSLRRVPIPAMKEKQEELKKEEFAEKVYLDVGKKLSVTKDELFEKTYEDIFEHYPNVFEALYTIMLDNKKIEMFKKLNKKEQEAFVSIINDKIKPEEFVYKANFELKSTAPNGVVLIKEAIKRAEEAVKHKRMTINYLAAGHFGVVVKHDDIKAAAMVFTNLKTALEKEAKQSKLIFSVIEAK